jgi:hypothetical protein
MRPAVNESPTLTVVDAAVADPESSQFCVTCIHGLALGQPTRAENWKG